MASERTRADSPKALYHQEQLELIYAAVARAPKIAPKVVAYNTGITQPDSPKAHRALIARHRAKVAARRAQSTKKETKHARAVIDPIVIWCALYVVARIIGMLH